METKFKIILASASQRRKRLMEQFGISFDVIDPGDVEERYCRTPEEYVKKNALNKATVVAKKFEEGIIIGADTTVVLDNKILGKPINSLEAKSMLTTLRGTIHRVLTGLVLIDAKTRHTELAVVETLVKMLPLSEEEIEGYVKTKEPFGKAGSYAIQGLGANIIESIHGCFYNVVGLPLSTLYVLLKKFNVNIF